MRTIIRRTLLIFIGIVIAFFLYSRIDPQWANKLISAIRGNSWSIQNDVVVIDPTSSGSTVSGSIVSGSTTSSSGGVIISSGTSADTDTGSFWWRIWGESETATTTSTWINTSTWSSSGSISGSGLISETGLITTWWMIPMSSGNVAGTGESWDILDPNNSNEWKSETSSNTSSNTIVTQTNVPTTNRTTSQTITRTITTTTTTRAHDGSIVYTFDNQNRNTLTQQDIEDTKQLFSQLIDWAQTNYSETTMITSFVLTNICWNIACTSDRPNIQLRGNGTRPSFVEFTRYDNANASTQYTNRSDIRIVQINNNSWIAYLAISNGGSLSCSQSNQKNLTSVNVRYTATINNQTVQWSTMGNSCNQ